MAGEEEEEPLEAYDPSPLILCLKNQERDLNEAYSNLF